MNRELFEQEWLKIAPAVFNYCRRAVRDHDCAKDIFQQTAIRAWRKCQSFRGDAPFLAWVLTIARNEVRRGMGTWNREQQRQVPFDESFDTSHTAEADDSHAPSGPTPNAFVQLLATAQQKRELSPVEAEVLKLRLIHPGKNWAELGLLIAIKGGTAATIHCRAIDKFRVFLFLCHPDILGGLENIRTAFAMAATGSGDQLTPSEAECFDLKVLRHRTDYRRSGWRLHLRSACFKVARILKPEFGALCNPRAKPPPYHRGSAGEAGLSEEPAS